MKTEQRGDKEEGGGRTKEEEEDKGREGGAFQELKELISCIIC